MACLSVSGHKFLGATLTGINTTLGWGSNGTSVDVSLVEDLCKGDNFDPPLVGSPVCGTVGNGGWYFGGFLDSWEFKSSTSAGHTYSVKIVDPTQLLQNYHCVLGNYDGSVFGVPNLANVFGYLEQNFGVGCFDSINGDKSGVNYVPATGWGGAHINSGGIPSTLVLTALDSILNGSGGTFGTYPLYRNNSYLVDLSRLTTLPVYDYNYRIGGDSLNLLDIIDRMCKDSGFDYYCGLDCAGTTVTIYPVPINNFGGFVGANSMDVSGGDIDAGDIAKAAGTGTYYSNKSIGLNHRKETLNAFTVGDNFQGVHQVTAVQTCNIANATIWPYWGQDWNDNPIIAQGCNDNHCFMADSREWNVIGVGAFYPLCVAEIRAALVNKDAWLSWLAVNKRPFWELMQWEAKFNFLELITEAVTDGNVPAWWDAPNKDQQDRANVRKNEITQDKNIGNLHNAIKHMATEFYGKKFMVAIPFVCRYFEDDTGELKLNWDKTDAGWSEPYTVSIIGLDNPTTGLLVFKNEQGKIVPFIRYDNAEKLDLTFLQKGDFYFEAGYIWIKCNVSKLVRTGGRFWAVIDLKSRVFLARDEADDKPARGFFIKLIDDAMAQDPPLIDADGKAKFLEMLRVGVNVKMFFLKDGPRAVLPNAAAIPLKSNKVSYGPWYGGYLGGKTEYARDTTFSPWNYGSASQMQLAGTIHTIFKVSTVEVAEQGSLTAPGYPVALLAQRAGVITGSGNYGPIITNIQVKHDTSAVQTTYQFKTFANKWGSLSKQILDGMQRRGQATNKQAHLLLQRLLEPPPPNAAIFRMRMLWIFAMGEPGEMENDGQTVHNMFMGMSEVRPSGYCRSDVVTGVWKKDFSWIDAVNKGSAWGTTTAGVCPKGLFRPFQTELSENMSYLEDISDSSYSNASGLEEYVEGVQFHAGTAKAETNKFYPKAPMPPVYQEYNMPITIKTLNPFKGGLINDSLYGFEHMNDSESDRHDIDFVVRGSTWPVRAKIFHHPDIGAANNLTDSHYRAMSLRGPIIITGWGFDLDGAPVPRECEETCSSEPVPPATADKHKFLENWLTKPHKWKTGALDVRWDEERGLWVAPPSFKLITASACGACGPNPDDKALFQFIGDDDHTTNDEKRYDKDGELTTAWDDTCECGAEAIPPPVSPVPAKQVLALNQTGKVILGGAKVMLYFDTRHHKYYVITAPDPIVQAVMTGMMEPNEVGGALIDGHISTNSDTDADGLGIWDKDGCKNILRVVNTLKQPICAGKKIFAYITDVPPKRTSGQDGAYWKKYVDRADAEPWDYKGEVLQAEFDPVTVVTSVDCYEASDTGEPTLEICDRRIYLQTAWTIEDCADDDPTARFDTKGWNPVGEAEIPVENKKPDEDEFCPDPLPDRDDDEGPSE